MKPASSRGCHGLAVSSSRRAVDGTEVCHLLESFEKAGLARRLRRGLWALRTDVDPFTVPPHLTAPMPAYVSLWSAFTHRGMIEQVPRLIFVVSLARAQTIGTSAGVYSIHHIAPELFDGYEGSEEGGYIAVPEKALFDTVYLRGRRRPSGAARTRIDHWIRRSTNRDPDGAHRARPRLRTLASRELERILKPR